MKEQMLSRFVTLRSRSMQNVSFNICGMLKHAVLLVFLAGCIEAYGPGFAGEPPSLVLYSNLTGLVLDCLARGEPPPVIDWVDENGNLLSLSPNFARRLDNGSLHFLPLAYESSRHPGYEETRIRCRASNPYGIIVSKIISVKPVLLNQVSVRVVAEPVIKFNTAVLRCQVPQTAALYTKIQSWQRGNTIIYPTSKGDGKYHVVPSGDLHVLRSDQGDISMAYICRVKNILTGLEETSPPFQLTVQDDVSVPTKPKELIHQDLYYSVRQDEPAVLACNVQSNPPPAFSWFRVRNNLLEPLSLTSRLHLSAGILVIEHSQLEDSGQYRCTARNERGEVNLIMNLDVATDISVDVIPSEQIIDIGRQARLECFTETKNGLTITWMKDGLPLANHRRIVTSQQILEIFNLQREDYGMYQCFVSRGAQEAQAASELRLGDAAPAMSYRFIDQTLQPGPPVSLKCSARGSPTPQVSWTLHGFPLPKSDRFLIGQYVTIHGEVVSHVNISRVEVEDGGLYTCIVENRAGTTRHEGRLNIYGPPYVHPIPELRAVVGKEFSFMCPASGYPIDRISWAKDNVGLPLEHRQRVFDNGTLVIGKVTRKDAGTYSCTATDRQGTSSTQSGAIKVIVAPTINKFSVGEHLRLGQRVSMLCSVTDGDLPIHLQWYRDDRLLIPGSDGSAANGDVSITEIGNYESVLRIDDLRPEHNANYTCVAENYAGKAQHSLTLRVKVPPEWIVKPVDQAAVEGQDVVFQCRVAGIPLPTVTWRKLDKNDAASSRRTLMELNYQRPVYRNYRLLSNGSLLIEHASEEDEGRLMCEADNGVNEPLVKIVNLNINAPPKFVASHSGPVTGRTKESVDLVCEAVGDDHISIKWLKEGKEYLTLPGKSSTTEIRELERVTSKLKIVDSEKDDAGRYSCQATNAFGSSHFTVDVTIWEPPPTPHNLTILEITSRSVKVSWTLESSSPIVDRIVIQWKEHSEDWYPEGKQNIQAGHLKDALVSSLNPWTVYHLRMFAENQLGKSKEGKVLQFLTHGEKPSGPPRNVRITGLSSTSLEVTWDDPEKRLMNGPVTRYSLGYREYNSQNYRFVDVDKADYGDDPAGNSCRFIIGRLRKFTKYEIIIRAINSHGEGPLSRPSVGQTQEDAPDGAPEKGHCVALTSSTIQVSWHPTEMHLRNGIIKGYKVLYAPHPGLTPVANLPLPKISRLSSVTTVLDNLRKFSNYSIQVAAFTAAGDGKFSNIITCATHTDVPGPPKGVKAAIKSPRSVIVSWLEPEQPNGVVERYHVYLRRIHPHVVDRSHNKYTRPADVRWITIEDLEPDRQYQFWVTAVTNAGEGLSSNVVTQTPSARVPAAVATMDEDHYLPLGSELTMDCRYTGEPSPNKKWFYNGREEGWLAQRSLFADTEMDIPNLSKEHEGNYTCYVENSIGTDSVTHRVIVQEPPKSPSIHILKTTPTSVSVRWRVTDDGNSPITKVILNYKMTYGEWADQEVVWHKQEESLTNLHCGREYHVYVVVFNALGASPASQVLTTRTLGSRPTGPTESEDFIVANTTFLSLKLDLWRDNRCDILYFVVEYKHDASDVWTTVTNDLQPQTRYSIRGLSQNTQYELKVTAHNHAGSTTLRYSISTLAENQSGAAPYENGTSHIQNVFMGMGVRSILLIVVSALCLVLSSIGVCVCLRKKHSPHVGMRYGEIPKSCTMENRTNIEHQLYATIQRKQPPVPPFTGATNVSKGFDTIDRLKMVRGVGETRMTGPATGNGNEASIPIPQSGTTLCPYASSVYYQSNLKAGRCATLGRIKTLEMTECQKQQMMNEANNLTRGVKDNKEYTLSLGRSHKLRRKPYSESEEYDTDSSGERGDLSSRAESSNHLSRQQVPVPAVSRYTGLKYRQHFNL